MQQELSNKTKGKCLQKRIQNDFWGGEGVDFYQITLFTLCIQKGWPKQTLKIQIRRRRMFCGVRGLVEEKLNPL